MKSDLCKGQLVTWKDDRGFGFIQPREGGAEVFLHISQVKHAVRRPQVGDTISYQVATDEAGKVRAVNARIAGATVLAASQTQRRSIQPTVKTSIWVEASLLAVIPVLGAIHLALTAANPIPLLFYCVMSGLAFALYRDDKSRAEQEQRRIPESNLLLLDLIGGWIGGFVAQRLFRHKISKISYQLVFRSIVAIHIAFWFDSLLLGGALSKSIGNRLSS